MTEDMWKIQISRDYNTGGWVCVGIYNAQTEQVTITIGPLESEIVARKALERRIKSYGGDRAATGDRWL